jgi:hypothetical protein
VLTVNCDGTFFCNRAAVREMLRTRPRAHRQHRIDRRQISRPSVAFRAVSPAPQGRATVPLRNGCPPSVDGSQHRQTRSSSRVEPCCCLVRHPMGVRLGVRARLWELQLSSTGREPRRSVSDETVWTPSEPFPRSRSALMRGTISRSRTSRSAPALRALPLLTTTSERRDRLSGLTPQIQPRRTNRICAPFRLEVTRGRRFWHGRRRGEPVTQPKRAEAERAASTASGPSTAVVSPRTHAEANASHPRWAYPEPAVRVPKTSCPLGKRFDTAARASAVAGSLDRRGKRGVCGSLNALRDASSPLPTVLRRLQPERWLRRHRGRSPTVRRRSATPTSGRRRTHPDPIGRRAHPALGAGRVRLT